MFFPLFFTGGFGYCLLEYIWRGYTHWSMFLLGGICLYVLFVISIKFFHTPLIFQAITGSLFITCAEFVTGVVVNILLGWNVWSYKSVPFNLLGQICLPYSILWTALCFPVLFCYRLFIKKVRKTTKILH